MALEVRDNREEPSVRVVLILALAAGFLLVVGSGMVGLHFYYRDVVRPPQAAELLGTFPIPQIQPNPTQDLDGFIKRQNQQLAGYAWVDQGRGLVHIPIERAMELIASRGASALDPPDQSAAAAEREPRTPAPDGAPRAPASMPASPYGVRQ